MKPPLDYSQVHNILELTQLGYCVLKLPDLEPFVHNFLLLIFCLYMICVKKGFLRIAAMTLLSQTLIFPNLVLYFNLL